MGFPSFPETQLGRAWREMQHFTFHLCRVPGCHPQHLSTPNHRDVCVPPRMYCVYPATQSQIRQPQKKGCSGDTSEAIYLLHCCLTPLLLLLLLLSLPLCLCSFHSVCSLLAGRSRFTLAPHTISLTSRLGEEHSRPEARASPNSSHNIAAITTSNHTDGRTEILSSDPHSWISLFFLSFNQLCLSCFFPFFSPALYLIVHYWFLSVVRYMSINRQI